MDLSRSLVKKFSKSVTQPDNSNVETYIRGTIKVIGDKKFVQLDGSEQMTPVSEVTDAQDGDRVLVTIEKHMATVIGNYTYPPSARVANEALDKAENSQNAADEASAKAEESKNIASEAIASASSSQQLAEEAIASASKANEDISAINSNLGDVIVAWDEFAMDVYDNIERIDENLKADYAKKTEVAEIEAHLTAEISKSAAELKTTMSADYVGKTEFVEIQADLQTQIAQNAEGITSSATKISNLETNTAAIQNEVLAAKELANAAQSELDEAKSNLQTVTSRVDATEQEIDAAQQAVNKAQAAVDKAQAAVDKAQADLEAVTSRLTTAETKIVQNAEAITLTANKVENIQIGGRNYILDSSNLVINNLNSTVGSRKEYSYLNLGQSYMDIETNTEVTVSFDLEMQVNTANPTLLVYNSNRKGLKKFQTVPTTPLKFTAEVGSIIKQRCFVTGILIEWESPTLTDNYLEFYSTYDTSNWYKISNLKLEIGNKATDWTPAPEDIDATFDLYSTTVEMNSAIEQKADSIKSEVSTQIDGVTNRLSTVEQTASGISSRVTDVENTEVDNTNRIITAESDITQLADQISSLVQDGSGKSLMIQTATGWTFSMGSFEAALNNLLSHIIVGTYNDQPCLELTVDGSKQRLMLTNADIRFMESDTPAAYITGDTMNIDNAKIDNKFSIDGYEWSLDSDDTLNLVFN